MAVIFRFGTLKLNSKVSSCNLIAYFSVDPYTRPPQKEDGALIKVVLCHMMDALLGCELPTWCAI